MQTEITLSPISLQEIINSAFPSWDMKPTPDLLPLFQIWSFPNVSPEDTSVGMGEVVITASVPTFKMKGGNVVANVANSVLNRETKVMDVLRKIPGMTMEDGQLPFTGGIPIIYINGKKLVPLTK